MRLIGNLLLVIAVTVGALSASSAYVVSLDSTPTEALVDLKLNAAAGLEIGPDGSPTGEPLAEKGDLLTTELIERLKLQATAELRLDDDTPPVSNVQVQKFQFGLWSGRWYFLLSIAGLVVGGYLVKSAGKKAIEAAHIEHKESGVSPADALGRMKSVIDELIDELPKMEDDSQRNRTIVARIGALQRDEVQFFVDARTLLIAELGLGGFASLMDRFAGAERQINRAWSAAADDHFGEAWASVNRASPIFAEAIAKVHPMNSD